MCETAHQKKGIFVNLDGAFPACGGPLPSVIAFGVRSASLRRVRTHSGVGR